MLILFGVNSYIPHMHIYIRIEVRVNRRSEQKKPAPSFSTSSNIITKPLSLNSLSLSLPSKLLPLFELLQFLGLYYFSFAFSLSSAATYHAQASLFHIKRTFGSWEWAKPGKPQARIRLLLLGTIQTALTACMFRTPSPSIARGSRQAL